MTRVFERETALCFNSTDFERESFNPDTFVATQGRVVDLQVLLSDLQSYHSKVKNSLIEVINKDYQDFVDLSKTLVGVDQSIASVDYPVSQWREQLNQTQRQLEQLIGQASLLLERNMASHRRKSQLTALKAVYTILVFLESRLFNSVGEKIQVIDLDLMKRISLELSSVKSKFVLCGPDMINDLLRKRVADVETHFLHLIGNIFTESVSTENSDTLLAAFQMYTAIEKVDVAEELYRTTFVTPYLKTKVTSAVFNESGLQAIYDAILDYIPRKASFIIRTTSMGNVDFNFEISSVFVEAVRLLVLNCSQVFIPGNWRQFKVRHDQSMLFLSSFEASFHSERMVDLFRKHVDYRRFCNKWSLPVYFQLLFQDLTASVETAITNSAYMSSHHSRVQKQEVESFQLAVSDTAYHCIAQCWSSEAFLMPLIHKFVKLTFQLSFRYMNWSEDARRCYPHVQPVLQKPDVANEGTVSTAKVKDQLVYNDFVVYLLADMETMAVELRALFSGRIREEMIKLPLDQCGTELVGNNSLLESVSTRMLQNLSPVKLEIVDILHKQCVSALKLVLEIPRLFRKTNRSVPESKSDYVKCVAEILSDFSNSYSRVLSVGCFSEIFRTTSERVCEEYRNNIHEICDSVEKIDQSLKKIRSSKSLKSLGDIQVTDKGVSFLTDSEKMYLQLYIDVEFLSCQLCVFLPSLESSQILDALTQSVQFASVYKEKVSSGLC